MQKNTHIICKNNRSWEFVYNGVLPKTRTIVIILKMGRGKLITKVGKMKHDKGIQQSSGENQKRCSR
jgi:hypothetical protein